MKFELLQRRSSTRSWLSPADPPVPPSSAASLVEVLAAAAVTSEAFRPYSSCNQSTAASSPSPSASKMSGAVSSLCGYALLVYSNHSSIPLALLKILK